MFDWLIGRSSRLPFSILLSLRSQLSDRFIVSGLTVLAVATSVSLAMSVEVASRALQEGLRTTTQALVGSAALTISAGDVGVPEEVLAQVNAVPGVSGASPLIRQTFRVASGEGKGRALHVVGLDLLVESDVRRYEISREGVVVRDALRLLALPNSIVVSTTFAADVGLRDGDPLPLSLDGKPVGLVVRGILGGEMADAFGGQVAAMDIFAMQQIVGMQGRFEQIDVAVESDQAIEEVVARIEEAIGPTISVGRGAERETFGLALLRTYQRALWAFVLVALATSVLLAYTVTSMSIDHRLEELSLLRAAGMEGSRVGRAVLADAFVVAVVGTALGAGAAPFVTRAVFGVLSVASATLSKVELSSVHLAVPTVVLGLLVGIASVIAAAAPAARQAARIGPLELLDLGRGAVRLDRTRRQSSFFAIAGATLLALAWVETAGPSALRVVAGIVGGIALSAGLGHLLIDRCANPASRFARLVPRVGFLIGPTLRDRPVETALTLAAWTTIAAGLITGVATIRSYTGSIDSYYYGLYGESAVFLLAGDPFGSKDLEPIAPATLEMLHASGLVEEVALLRGIEVPFRGKEIVVTSFATEVIGRRGAIRSISPNPDEVSAALNRGELAMNASFGDKFDMRVGDRLELPTRSGGRSFRIGVSVNGVAGPNGSVLLDESVFNEAFASSKAESWMAALWLKAPEDDAIDELRQAKSTQPLYFMRGREARRIVARSAEKYRAMLSVPVVLVCSLGLISLQSLIFGGMRTRKREFALLRASGATRGNVMAIVTLSGSLVGILGALLGIAIGSVWSTVTCSFLSEAMGWTIEPLVGADVSALVCAGAAAVAVFGSLAAAFLSTRKQELVGAPTP